MVKNLLMQLALEQELKDRLDVHEAAIVTILQRVMDIIDPPARPEPPKKNRFQAFTIDLSPEVFSPAILITGAGMATLSA